MTGDEEPQEVLIITGMSGAGRSTVADSLEDIGWYVVDNLPPQMLKHLVELATRAGTRIPKLAAVVDVRGRDFFSNLRDIIHALRDGTQLRVVFLEATDDTLVRRFEQVRRPHPLQGDGTILDGIAIERTLMSEVRALGDLIIDTSDLNIHQLATMIRETFAAEDTAGLQVTVMSFGFKYGMPTDVDHVADARFLPNPYWIPELRPYTGLDETVREFVFGLPGEAEFVANYVEALKPVFAGYQRENKRHVTIAIGCTGGKHRSVAIAGQLGELLRELPGAVVSVKHRDLGRE
ncbi:RNase adapter RapZ [Homoserinimonas sp. OAct 916]|uniref:RNase adapter RapZ n=1 Tax=Homoserinimonas sp. OAct 916 TaxID=2211450 RepID=UPI000DBE5068|nr:RNase adapter RapZ [Homoserinimonas sp. OAct 916]